jgi:hypothetical protein
MLYVKIFRTSLQLCWMTIYFSMYVPLLSTVFRQVISGFRSEVAKNWTLLDYYTASSGNFLPKFQDKASSLRHYHYSLRNNPEERNSHLRIPLFCYVTPSVEAITYPWTVEIRLLIDDATSDSWRTVPSDTQLQEIQNSQQEIIQNYTAEKIKDTPPKINSVFAS